MMVSEFKIYNIIARLCGLIADVQGSILVIFTLDLSLRRSLDRQRKTTIAFKCKTEFFTLGICT